MNTRVGSRAACAPPLLSVVLDSAVVVAAAVAVTVSDRSRASLGREEVLDASLLLDAAWLLISDT